MYDLGSMLSGDAYTLVICHACSIFNGTLNPPSTPQITQINRKFYRLLKTKIYITHHGRSRETNLYLPVYQ